jgi:uncharacterized protein YbjQ (UPF0145 family)
VRTPSGTCSPASATSSAGRSAAYERELQRAKDLAIREMAERAQEMGANAVIGIDLDYETVGQNGSMLMVAASGTAVVAT